MSSVSSNSLSPLSSFTGYTLPKPNTPRFLQVRSQSFKDEGDSSNIVDANLRVLRARMEEVMKNEKLEKAHQGMKSIGWKYNTRLVEHDAQHKNGHVAMDALVLVGGSLGFIFLFGSLSIFLVSVLVRLCS